MHMGLGANERDRFGYTPLAYLYRSTDDCSGAIDLFRLLASKGELEGFVDSIFDPDYRALLRETSLHRLIWTVPDLLPVITAEVHANFVQMPPTSKYSSLIWEYVDPELLLSVLHDDRVTTPATFRAHLHTSVERSLHTFAKVYFSRSPLIRRTSARSENDPDRERIFHRWRMLARWIFKDIPVQEISKQGDAPWESSSPLFAALTGCDWSVPETAKERRFLLRRLNRTTQMWLEDARLSGVNLSEYGRHELQLHTADNWNHTWRWSVLGLEEDAQYPSGPHLVSFSYGPRPEQWKFEWDLAVEEYVDDFWEMVSSSPLRIPGGWVDEW